METCSRPTRIKALTGVLTCLFLTCLTTLVIYEDDFGSWMVMWPKAHELPSPDHWDGTLYSRQNIKALNEILLKELDMHSEIIEKVQIPPENENRWPNTILKYLDAESDNYFTQLKSVQNIRTVFFNLSRSIAMSLINTKIYAVHSNDCKTFQSRGGLSSWSVKKLPCLEGAEYVSQYPNIDDIKHYNFQTGLFSSRQFASDSENYITVGFLQVVKDAYILAKGDYITAGTYNSIGRCHREDKKKQKNTKVQPYAKVFSIAHFWGMSFYHFTVESLPRIVLSLPFLLKHKDIKVHIMVKSVFQTSYLSSLGISSDRIITGDIRAKTAYIPNGARCGRGQVIANNIESVFLRAGLSTEHTRDTIVLVRRSSRGRQFRNHDSILKMIKQAANTFKLRVEVFGDNPVPEFNVTKNMFNRAAAIVAPHGSGLANMVLAQPGTCVIEGVCYHAGIKPGVRRINHCFVYMAQLLGHRYHGVVPAKNSCLYMEPHELAPQLNQCLKHLLQINPVKAT